MYRNANGPVEHPGRDLQPSARCASTAAAAENLPAALLNHLMNLHPTSRPWMQRIQNLSLLGPVGVAASGSTITRVRIRHWRTGRRWRPGAAASAATSGPRLWICRFVWTTLTRCPHIHSRDNSSKQPDIHDGRSGTASTLSSGPGCRCIKARAARPLPSGPSGAPERHLVQIGRAHV